MKKYILKYVGESECVGGIIECLLLTEIELIKEAQKIDESVKTISEVKDLVESQSENWELIIIPFEKVESNICPNCGSEEVDWDTFEMQDCSQGFFKGRCTNCGTTWEQWNKLEFIENRDIEKEDES